MNCPFRQYFSLNGVLSQRKTLTEQRDSIDVRKTARIMYQLSSFLPSTGYVKLVHPNMPFSILESETSPGKTGKKNIHYDKVYTKSN